MKTLHTLAAILLAATLITGCSRETTSNTLKIGAILPLTGTGAEDGEFQKHGIELAVSKLNSAGGIQGKKIEVVYEDSKNQAKEGITALNTLISRDKVPVVLSTMSGVSAPLAAYAGNKVHQS